MNNKLRIFNSFISYALKLIWLRILIYLVCSYNCTLLELSSQFLNQTNQIKFERITVDHGISQSTIYCILQDRSGLLWFGTEDGLNRFDGYKFKIYKNNPTDSNSISNNYILTAFEDHRGDLWFGTGNGLNKYDPVKDKFTTYLFDKKNSIHSSSGYITSIYETIKNPGELWIGTYEGLKKISFKGNQRDSAFSIQHFNHDSARINSLSNNVVTSIVEDYLGNLWIGTSDGLNRFNPENLIFKCYKHDPNNSNSISNNKITSVCIDKAGNLWIGTNGGLNKLLLKDFNSVSPSFVHYKNDHNNSLSISNDRVTSIYESHTGTIWIGTFNGLNKLVQKYSESLEQTFIRYTYVKNNSNTIIDNWIRSIYEDRTGILWVGCLGGLNKFSPKKNKFPHYQLHDSSSQDFTNNLIFTFGEDRNNTLWIGTYEEGLWGFEKQSGKVKRYKHIPGNNKSLSSNRIRSILTDKKGNLWIGTLGGGLNKFDGLNNRFIHYQYEATNKYSLRSNDVIVIYEDHYGDIWIGTSRGLNRFDAKNDRFIQYLNDPSNPNSLCNNLIWAISEDESNNLWIGTDNGLDKYDRKTKTFFHYKVDSNRFANNRIYSIYNDKSGSLWIGTCGGGLKKFDDGQGIFKDYSIKEGLPNDVIYGILEDNNNNLWLSTNYGLSKFNKNQGTFHNFDVADGLQSNEFNLGASYKTRDGIMYFGGVNGFNAFDPDSVKPSRFIPPIIITSFLIFNKEVVLDKSISSLDKIELSYKDYVFSFEFASLDYQAAGKIKYAYKMEGLDNDWIFTTAEKRYATFTTLPPGDYIFRVKGTNCDGVWNEEGTRIKIIITPPFWQTLWFRLLLIITFIFTLAIIFHKKIKSIEKKKQSLELQVKERTEANEKIQAALSEVEKLKNQLQAENIYLQDEIKLTHNFENIISVSESFKRILYRVEQVSSTNATVLILGESGTGKELLARAIHSLSNRKSKPLIKVNCATLPAYLIESELFGHEKGAFTGAIIRKIGKFEVADGGTIFLDEIGELPFDLQAKLLRVLQEGEFERVGGTSTSHVDVRVIAATNRNIENYMKQGGFREDLYYRLYVFPITIPPLRDRKEDIPVLVNHFITKHNRKIGKNIESISPIMMKKLIEYHWPGNVRELENVLERAIIISQTKNLILEDSFFKSEQTSEINVFQSLEEIERKYIIEVLESTNWRVSGPKGAAKILGLAPSTLEFRMKKLNIRKK